VLVQAELTEFLGKRHHEFDVIVSADTLVYFGDLSAVITAAAGALRGCGRLVFTLEHLADDSVVDYRLEWHGRYRPVTRPVAALNGWCAPPAWATASRSTRRISPAAESPSRVVERGATAQLARSIRRQISLRATQLRDRHPGRLRQERIPFHGIAHHHELRVARSTGSASGWTLHRSELRG